MTVVFLRRGQRSTKPTDAASLHSLIAVVKSNKRNAVLMYWQDFRDGQLFRPFEPRVFTFEETLWNVPKTNMEHGLFKYGLFSPLSFLQSWYHRRCRFYTGNCWVHVLLPALFFFCFFLSRSMCQYVLSRGIVNPLALQEESLSDPSSPSYVTRLQYHFSTWIPWLCTAHYLALSPWGFSYLALFI